MDISKLLDPKNMTLELKATTRIDAIKELIGILHASGTISDPEEILRAVLQREEEFSTGIGFQVAIPHAKSPCVNQAAIAYGRSENGVEWPSEDGVNPKMIFMIMAPCNADDAHLKLLAQMCRKLIHEDVRENILNAKEKEDVINALN